MTLNTVAAEPAPATALAAPSLPRSLEETGLSLDLVTQLVVKTLHFAGELSGADLCRRLGVAFPVVEPALAELKRQRHCEIVGGALFGGPSYRYRITDAGRERAGLFLQHSHYCGVAPVPLGEYVGYMRGVEAARSSTVTRADLAAAFGHLVLGGSVLDRLGPAINAGHSMFLYGPPGNGKTAIAQALGTLFHGELWIPHAIEVEGQIIRVYDPVNHRRLEEEPRDDVVEREDAVDRRWVRCRRPLVTVGGELTMASLELAYSPSSRFYAAPIQVVANGGVLLVDDFGRQHCSPQDLLNRWIVPLENRVDFLTLHTGQKFALPFAVFVVFATNLRPADLVDEAFLRRIQYKVLAGSPTHDEYRRIFERCCEGRGIPFDPALVDELLRDYYGPRNLRLRGCHPRDLISQALALADYRGLPRRLTQSLLLDACSTYFVDDGREAA